MTPTEQVRSPCIFRSRKYLSCILSRKSCQEFFAGPSGFVYHPGREAFEKLFEAFHVLNRELIFHIGPFQYSLETAEPDLSCAFIDLKWKVPGSHAWWSIFFEVQGRST